ncbi:SDR family oxidoreductase, partial [Helicobacter bizzozeronii]|uniref:SDR family oxidoreductase n=1 Tax=Helicobacter bizzozeronii TaxID=56877 RepID=UPI00255732CA
MNSVLKDKNIVVTGGSRGIGKATLELCVQSGANAIAVFRRENAEAIHQLQELAKQHGVGVDVFYADF